MTAQSGDARRLLRHTLATVAYRGAKACRGVPPGFSTFRLGEGTRTPGQILAHLGDLFAWALTLANGKAAWVAAEPGAWDDDVTRFLSLVRQLDEALARGQPLACGDEQLFQGPIADALTHIGQLALLRRRAGAPVRGENYFVAAIEVGRVGADQAAPRREFD